MYIAINIWSLRDLAFLEQHTLTPRAKTELQRISDNQFAELS